MSAAAEPLAPAIVQALWSQVGAIPGCVLSHATAEPVQGSGGARPVTIGIDGWSPSLHAVSMELRVVTVGATDHEGMLRQILATIRHELTIQARRARDGLALGQAVPFHIDREAVGHLSIDASLLALMLERHAPQGSTPMATVRAHIAVPLGHLHNSALDHRGGSVLSDTLTTVRETPASRIVEVSHTLDQEGVHPTRRYRDGNAVVTIEGRSVLIHGRVLPLTAAAAAVGRPLGDIAAIHPFLDTRIVQAVEVGDEWTEVALEPRYVRLGTVTALGVDDAIRALGFATDATEC